MRLYSYLKKAGLILAAKTLYRKNLIPGSQLYLFNLPRSKPITKVLFYFNNPQFMHLGDHLFFIPVIKNFIDSGYQVEIMVTLPMREVFEQLNLPIIATPKPYAYYDLIISRFELIPQFKRYSAALVDVSLNLHLPICSQLLNSFQAYFKLPTYTAVSYYNLKDDLILSKLGLQPNTKYIVFNPYCDSSAYLITHSKLKKLYLWVNKLAIANQAQIIFTGSQQDKDNDKNKYEFSCIDMRGKTTVIELFQLVNFPNVTYYVGFDSFIMHIFSLLHKRSFVVFRGRLTKRQATMLKRNHVHLSQGDHYVRLM